MIKEYLENKYIKIDTLSILFVIAGFMLIIPDYFYRIPTMVHLYSFRIYVFSALLFYMVVVGLYKIKWGICVTLFSTIYIWLLFVSIINNNARIFYADCKSSIFGFFMVYVAVQLYPKKLLNAFSVLLSSYTLINFLIIILFPNGLAVTKSEFVNGVDEKTFFMGSNTAIKITILCIFILLIKDIMYKGTITVFSKIMAAIIVVSSILMDSSTSTITSSIILLAVLLGFSDRICFFNIKNGMILNFVFFVCIVVLKLQTYLSFILVDVMHKDISMTGRDTIWNMGLLYIIKNPIIGYGVEARRVVASKLLVANDSMHNFILDWTYQGGIVILLLWIIFLVSVSKYNKQNNNIIRNINNVCFFAMMVEWMAEPFSRNRIITSLVMLAIITGLINVKKDGEFENELRE